MGVARGVKLYIVACGLDPVDLVRTEKDHATALLHHQPIDVRWRVEARQQRGETSTQLAFAPRLCRLCELDLPPYTHERRSESVAVERLGEIIQCADFERLNRVLIERGDEDDHWRAVHAQRAHDGKP